MGMPSFFGEPTSELRRRKKASNVFMTRLKKLVFQSFSQQSHQSLLSRWDLYLLCRLCIGFVSMLRQLLRLISYYKSPPLLRLLSWMNTEYRRSEEIFWY